ncbi:MAG TPA: hypothetical protein VKV02_11310 [Acidobacteriaceae bacterium]|nr:hypothetical protein [Acidobacteriaceae bacterium]
MATPAHTKYYLKSLHEEIDLYDRKLAHMEKYDSFANDAERKASTGKLLTKRETLAKAARQLVEEGIEFKSSDLPRSFRPAEDITEAVPEEAHKEATSTEVTVESVSQAFLSKPIPSPFAGTVLDGSAHVEAYKRNRAKSSSPQA